jgi:hypothetical protein
MRNNYIEGTMVELTVEFGNTFLEIIQDIKNNITYTEKTFSYSADDLRIPPRSLSRTAKVLSRIGVNGFGVSQL